MGYSFNKLTNNIVPAGTYKAVIREVSFKTSASGETKNDLVVNNDLIPSRPIIKKQIINFEHISDCFNQVEDLYRQAGESVLNLI